MRAEYVLRDRLLQTPELVNLVGGRFMPPPRPQTGSGAALPAVVYQRVSPGPMFSEHTGPSLFAMPRVQFSCFARTEAEAWAVATLARQALDGWSDRTATPRIDGVTCEEPLDTYENDTQVYHVYFDAIVRFGR